MNKTEKPKIKEKEVEVTLSYASYTKYNNLGYNFKKEWVTERRKVVVKVADLTRKSNVKITRICLKCGKETYMTYHKANISPICHHCITQSIEFSKKTGIGTQNSRVKKGDKAYYKTSYELAYGKIPKGWCIHHIDMDKSNDDLNNLIALPHGEHLKLHWSLNKLTKELINRGIIKFDREKLKYIFVCFEY